MGNRVAELKEAGSDHTSGWIVFQSTAMACFTPIFGDELSAWLFAATLPDIYPDWSDKAQEKLSTRVSNFVREKFAFVEGQSGDSPEGHPDYDDCLSDHRKIDQLVEELRALPA